MNLNCTKAIDLFSPPTDSNWSSFPGDTSISNGKLDGSVDSVVVKLKETAIPLPPATLISIPPKPPPKLKSSSATPRSSSCPNHTITDTEKEVNKDTVASNSTSG